MVRFLRGHLRKRKFTAILVTGIILLAGLLIGTGVYAAFGGAPRLKNATSDIELQRGLLGHWKLNGNFKDATPNAYDGIVGSSATISTDRKGVADTAYSYNGTSANYTNIAHGTVYKPTPQQTVSVWVKPINLSSTTAQTLLSANETSGWSLSLTGSSAVSGCAAQSLCGLISIAGGLRSLSVAKTALSNNSWTHIVMAYDGTTRALYVDNAVVDSSSSHTGVIAQTTSPLCFAAEATASDCIGGDYFAGSLDDVRIYDRQLTAIEVGALYRQYDAGVKAASGAAKLVSHWKLDGNAKDSTPHANNLTVDGFVWDTDRKATATKAITFNNQATVYGGTAKQFVNPQVFSTAIWFKTAAVTGGHLIGMNSSSGTNGANFDRILYMENSGKLRFGVYSGSAKTIQSPLAYNDNVWHHAVSTVSAAGMVLYVDGTQVASDPTVTSPQNYNGYWQVGFNTLTGWPSAPTYYEFLGSLDDARVYDKALTTTEVTTLYNSYDANVQLSDLQKGLIGDWPLNGNGKDATPYANNATVPSTVSTTDRKGRTSGAYAFGGTGSDRLTVPNAAILNPTTKVTVSAWINGTVQNTGGAIKGIACKDDGGAVTQPPYCIFVQTGTVTWTTANSSNAVLNATSGASALVDNTWYHLVGTYDNSLGSNQAKLYINGVVAGNATGSSALAVSTTAFSIGTQKTFFASTRSFAGSIDDVRLWNRALSASEVQTLYNTYR